MHLKADRGTEFAIFVCVLGKLLLNFVCLHNCEENESLYNNNSTHERDKIFQILQLVCLKYEYFKSVIFFKRKTNKCSYRIF